MRRRLFDHPGVWRPLNEGEMLTLRTIRYSPCMGIEKVCRDLGETFGYYRRYSCIAGNINALVACKLVDDTRLTKQSNHWILQYSITELGARVVNEAVERVKR